MERYADWRMKGYSMRCSYCESETNDFVPMNQTVEYGGIEMAVNRQGMLRGESV